MKPALLQPQEGRFDFSTSDSLVDMARSRGLAVNGHTLVWHSQTPDWFFRDGDKPAGRELLLGRMRAHIAAVAGHFAGKVASWDMVNEAIDDGDAYLRPSPWLKDRSPKGIFPRPRGLPSKPTDTPIESVSHGFAWVISSK